MSEKDIPPPGASGPEDDKWQGIARAIMELDMKLQELELALGIRSGQEPGGRASVDGGDDSRGNGQNNDG